MIVLGIESTCDETAVAIVKDGKEILAESIFSQIFLHQKYGGVFPELASRSHFERIIPLLDETLNQASVKKEEIDLISVAKGPGLIGPLLIGVNVAKTLSICLNKPWIGVNHIEAHLYASMMHLKDPIFPAIGVVLSGGHTLLLLIENIGKYQEIGGTIDDAMGECFDKVASILDLPYPGGPSIEKLAKEGNPENFTLNPCKVKNKPFHFSFSGLKTKILYLTKGMTANKNSPLKIAEKDKKHLAASFQKTVFEDLLEKSLLAAKHHQCHTIYFGGGVTCNSSLRELFEKTSLNIHFPPKKLSLDNAVMIAGLGYHKYLEQKKSDPLDLFPQTRIPLGG